MGGHALKKTRTRRFSRAEYDSLQRRVLPVVARSFQRCSVPAFLQTKPDFGDLDIIVSCPVSTADPFKTVAAALSSREVVRNGPVVSLEIDGCQVDLLVCDEREHDLIVDYKSWADLGMLVGVLAKRLGLKYGEHGLQLRVYAQDDEYQYHREGLGETTRENGGGPSRAEETGAGIDSRQCQGPAGPSEDGDSELLGTICLTSRVDEALEFLGFDVRLWRAGFRSEKDIIHFLLSGRYVDTAIFADIPQSRDNRRRLAQRPMFARVIQEIQQMVDDQLPANLSRESNGSSEGRGCETDPGANRSAGQNQHNDSARYHRRRALEFFGKTEEAAGLQAKHRARRRFKVRYNKELVRQVTGKEARRWGK